MEEEGRRWNAPSGACVRGRGNEGEGYMAVGCCMYPYH